MLQPLKWMVTIPCQIVKIPCEMDEILCVRESKLHVRERVKILCKGACEIIIDQNSLLDNRHGTNVVRDGQNNAREGQNTMPRAPKFFLMRLTLTYRISFL